MGVRSALLVLQVTGNKLAVLSNALPNMLKTVMDAAGIADIFNALLSVDTVEC